MTNGEIADAPENGAPQFNRRRIPPPPTFLQHVSEWLLPILTVSVLGVGGYVANRVWSMNETVNTVATIQKEVRFNQAEMKADMKVIQATVDANGAKLDDHLLMTGVLQQNSSKLHHRRDVYPCTGCHDR